MNFYAIGPLAAAEIFKEHGYHMALAQYLYDRDYMDFMYNQRWTYNHEVILDSGVYEGSAVDDRQLLYWCKLLGPQAVILPDKPHDMRETRKLSLRFAQMLDDAKQPVKKWKVLHAACGEDFDTNYTYDSRLFDGVCFSRITEDFGSGLRRPQYIQSLRTRKLWNPNCYHHALGMKDGSLNELKALKDAGIDSCDSSAPIWRGLNGTELIMESAPFYLPFDPFYVGPSPSMHRAKENLLKVQAICA